MRDTSVLTLNSTSRMTLRDCVAVVVDITFLHKGFGVTHQSGIPIPADPFGRKQDRQTRTARRFSLGDKCVCALWPTCLAALRVAIRYALAMSPDPREGAVSFPWFAFPLPRLCLRTKGDRLGTLTSVSCPQLGRLCAWLPLWTPFSRGFRSGRCRSSCQRAVRFVFAVPPAVLVLSGVCLGMTIQIPKKNGDINPCGISSYDRILEAPPTRGGHLTGGIANTAAWV